MLNGGAQTPKGNNSPVSLMIVSSAVVKYSSETVKCCMAKAAVYEVTVLYTKACCVDIEDSFVWSRILSCYCTM